jgi:hypothetical protein
MRCADMATPYGVLSTGSCRHTGVGKCPHCVKLVGAGLCKRPERLVVLGAHVLLLATLVLRGRWQPVTRRIDIGLTMVTCALPTWILFSANVFQAPPTNQAMRLAIIVIVPGRAGQLGA